MDFLFSNRGRTYQGSSNKCTHSNYLPVQRWLHIQESPVYLLSDPVVDFPYPHRHPLFLDLDCHQALVQLQAPEVHILFRCSPNPIFIEDPMMTSSPTVVSQ